MDFTVNFPKNSPYHTLLIFAEFLRKFAQRLIYYDLGIISGFFSFIFPALISEIHPTIIRKIPLGITLKNRAETRLRTLKKSSRNV